MEIKYGYDDGRLPLQPLKPTSSCSCIADESGKEALEKVNNILSDADEALDSFKEVQERFENLEIPSTDGFLTKEDVETMIQEAIKKALDEYEPPQNQDPCETCANFVTKDYLNEELYKLKMYLPCSIKEMDGGERLIHDVKDLKNRIKNIEKKLGIIEEDSDETTEEDNQD